jgi:hypothetical protein
LRRYDLVIETIGDADTAATRGRTNDTAGRFQTPVDPEDVVRIRAARAHFHGSTCSRQEHAALSYKALSTAPELGGREAVEQKRPGASSLEFTNIDLYAPKLPFDQLSGDSNITAFFQLVASLFRSTQPKEFEVVATSCGARAAGDARAGSPNGDLKALLRIYRRDKWTVGVKIPPLGRFSDKRESTRSASADRLSQLRGAYERANPTHRRTSSTGLGFDALSSTSTQYRSDRFSTDVEDMWLGTARVREMSVRRGGAYSFDSTRVSFESFKSRLQQASGFDFFVAWNGQEIGGERIKKMIDDLRNAFRIAREVFLGIFQAAKSVELGWSFEFEASLLAGSFLLEWAPQQLAGPTHDGRYYPVGYRIKGKIAMDLVNVSIKVSFGVSVRAGGERWATGVTAQIFGKLEFKANVERDIDFGLAQSKWEMDYNFEAGAQLGAVGWASVAGYTLVEGTLTASGGLELKGKFEFDWVTGKADVRGVLRSKAIKLTGKVKWLTFWTREIDPPVEVLAAKDLKTFG